MQTHYVSKKVTSWKAFAANAAAYRAPVLFLAVAAGAGLAWQPVNATGTPAGTVISNVATASYTDGTEVKLTSSNTNEMIVGEIIDVSVASSDPGDVLVQAGTSDQVLSFVVSNIGNGTEAFSFTAMASQPNDIPVAVSRIIIDSNGNGQYDPGVDVLYVAGNNTNRFANLLAVTQAP